MLAQCRVITRALHIAQVNRHSVVNCFASDVTSFGDETIEVDLDFLNRYLITTRVLKFRAQLLIMFYNNTYHKYLFVVYPMNWILQSTKRGFF